MVKVRREKSVSDTKKRPPPKHGDKQPPKDKEPRAKNRNSMIKLDEGFAPETSIELESEKEPDHELRKKAKLPCIVEESSLEHSRKESNELVVAPNQEGQLGSLFKSSLKREEAMGKEFKAHVADFKKKGDENIKIEQGTDQSTFAEKKPETSGGGSRESSIRDKTVKSGIISEGDNRTRANAKNKSFDYEKSVIEDTVREFKNLENHDNGAQEDVINNSKENHKDILIKMKFENLEIEEESELQNEMAMEAIARITKKFQGRDFENIGLLNAYGYKAQVARLIKEASDPFNLCQSYSGWNPFL